MTKISLSSLFVIAALCYWVRCDISYHRIGDVALSARHPTRLVLLWLSQRSLKDSLKWVKNIELPVVQWTRLGERELNELRTHVSRNTKVWVLVPSSDRVQRKELFAKLNATVFRLSLVRFVVALESSERLPYEGFPELSCILVAVNDTAIDVAEDSFRHCDTHRRILTSPSELFENHANDSYATFSGKTLTVGTDITLTTTNVSYSYTRIPESDLLMRTLRDLNATVISYHFKGTGIGEDRLFYKVHLKEVDISLLPGGLMEEQDSLVDVRAINAYRPVTFFSRKGGKVAPRLLNTILSSGHFFTALASCVFLVLVVYLCQTPVLGSTTSLARCILFLFSILVGRGYPEPPPTRSNGTRILVLFWAFGMLSVGSYLQSIITSEVNVPTLERQIRNTDDLLKQAEAKSVLPCLERGSFSERFLKTSTTDIGRTLGNLLENCPSCINTRSGRDGDCITLAVKGTHVYVRVYDVISDMIWRQFGVQASDDSLRFLPCAPIMPKNFPCGAALKRAVAELIEHGLHEKVMSMHLWRILHHFPHSRSGSETSDMAPIDFWDHFLVYAYGVLLACFVFLLEAYGAAFWYRSRARHARKLKARKFAALQKC
ncbi:hypothetical protein HPB48_010523 [Haemaphysalis longicornis]|uniref:Ionotropic receptor n=1 Tax=Haemaphysalis longicornis TaxID=44386 RepID=A0A9J6H3V2_HAELO|nr:hypothetical protein HPB48_010523 [Haemaphysalis longicornis]